MQSLPGVPILTCLKILSDQIQNKKLKEAIVKVNEDVKTGEVLSDAMRKHKDVFPDLLVSLTASGEASGSLDSVMLRMATHYEKENKINNKVKNAMIYPIVLGFVSVVAVTFILVYVMPTFMQIFEESGTQLPWSTKFLLGLSSGIQNNWIVMLFVLIIAILGLRIFLRSEQGILVSSKLKLKLPILKKLNEMIIVSRFTRTLSILMASGLSLIKALEIVSEVVGNKIVENAMIKIKDSVMRGDSLYSSMKQLSLSKKYAS